MSAAESQWEQLHTQCVALGDEGKFDEAIEAGTKALSLARTTFGAQDARVAESLKSLAMAHLGAGDSERSLTLLREGVAIGEKALAPESDAFIDLLHELCISLQVRGEDPEAVAVLRRIADLREKQHGAESPHVAKVLLELSRLLQESAPGDAQVEPVLARSISILEARTREPNDGSEEFDEAQFDLGVALGNLGYHRMQSGQPEQAMTLFERALDTLEKQAREGGFVDPDYVQVLFENGMRASSQLENGRDRQMAWGNRAAALLAEPMAERVLAEGEFWVALWQEASAWRDGLSIPESVIAQGFQAALANGAMPEQLTAVPGAKTLMDAFAQRLEGSRALAFANEALAQAVEGKLPLARLVHQLSEQRMEEVGESH